MIYHAKVKNIDGARSRITLELGLEEFSKIVNSIRERSLYIDVPNTKEITVQQRKVIYSMIDDIGKHIGYSKDEMKKILKVKYTASTGEKPFSLSNMGRQEATDFIHFCFDICIAMDIPIQLKTYDNIEKDDYIIKKLVLNRQCVICGKRADIDHWTETVGMGNNRNHTDQTQYELMPLCREHHTEKHKIGLEEFKNKYHLDKGVYLNANEIKQLGI